MNKFSIIHCGFYSQDDSPVDISRQQASIFFPTRLDKARELVADKKAMLMDKKSAIVQKLRSIR